MNRAFKDRISQGYGVGRDDGYQEGYTEGFSGATTSVDDAYYEGQEEGYPEGYKDATEGADDDELLENREEVEEAIWDGSHDCGRNCQCNRDAWSGYIYGMQMGEPRLLEREETAQRYYDDESNSVYSHGF